MSNSNTQANDTMLLISLVIMMVVLVTVIVAVVAPRAYSTQDTIDRSVINEHKAYLAANTNPDADNYY